MVVPDQVWSGASVPEHGLRVTVAAATVLEPAVDDRVEATVEDHAPSNAAHAAHRRRRYRTAVHVAAIKDQVVRLLRRVARVVIAESYEAVRVDRVRASRLLLHLDARDAPASDVWDSPRGADRLLIVG